MLAGYRGINNKPINCCGPVLHHYCCMIIILFFCKKRLMVGNSTNEHAPKHVFNNARHLGHGVGRCMGIDVKPRALSPPFFLINCIEKDVKGTTMSLEKSSTGKVNSLIRDLFYILHV